MRNRILLLLPAFLLARSALAGAIPPVKFSAVVNSIGDGSNLATPPACDADAVTPGSQCTLRAAIEAANAVGARGDETNRKIRFEIDPADLDPVTGRAVIALTRPLPALTKSVAITGLGVDALTVRRTSSSYRIFEVITSDGVTISDMTISNGVLESGSGGGIANAGNGPVDLLNCAIRDNRVDAGAGGGIANLGTGAINVTNCIIDGNQGSNGGGIYNGEGTVTVLRSTVNANKTPGSRGGGIYNGSGILHVTDSTISNNSTGGPAVGGGIANGGEATIVNCTFVGNRSNGGDGIRNEGFLTITNSTVFGHPVGGASSMIGIDNAVGGRAAVQSTIVAHDGTSTAPDVRGAFVTLGANLIGILNDSGFDAPDDLVGTAAAPLDPRVDPRGLRSNGGPTKTLALSCGSPAIDRGSAHDVASPLTDQRGAGFPRTFDDPTVANGDAGDGTDIGAFEVQGQCVASQPPALLDHFLAYGVRTTKKTAPFVARGPITLTDVFGANDYAVGAPAALALPADVNDAGRNDGVTHLLEHPVKIVKGAPKFATVPDVHLVNQCSDVFLAVKKPVSLLVPTAQSLTNAVDAPSETSHQVDHYLCYQAKVEAKLATGVRLPKPPRALQLEVVDQFQERRYDVGAVTKLCVPVGAAGAPVFSKGDAKGSLAPFTPTTPRHQDWLLVCYQAKLAHAEIPQAGCGPIDPLSKGTKIAPPQAKHTSKLGVFVADQLGPLRVDTVKERELCLPTVRSVP